MIVTLMVLSVSSFQMFYLLQVSKMFPYEALQQFLAVSCCR